ncbi:MAG: 2-C-methyl-D-erythritol 2,4-cyclodiphosphate synthase [Dethiobacter sp.]|nr:2-C-methyl-D-erythritol 2,4-cyclodiphosphate synthase [Dethiobacter sp.]
MRVGIGYDVHRFAPGRLLVLGGVSVPFAQGLAGHSDADVLVHAVMDAMLGALALDDIGRHFPDTDGRYKDASSIKLLAQVGELCREQGYSVGNTDAVIMAEQPKLAPYTEQMRANIAETLGISIGRVGIKATTTEGLGFCGRGEGIAAQAVVLLTRNEL